MTTRTKKKDKFAKLKVAAIPVLTLVLLYVLWGNLQPSDSLSDPSQSIATGQRTEEESVNSATQQGQKRRLEEWPEPDLAFLEEYSLFRDFRQPEETQPDLLVSTETATPRQDPQSILTEVADELKRAVVPFAFQSQKKNVVMFGDRLLEEGEEVRDSVFVRTINGSDLILEYRSPNTVD